MIDRHRFSFLVLLLASCLLATLPARAVDHAIQVGPGTTFSPQSLDIIRGDTVTWTKVGGGSHNVVDDHGLFRCANGCDFVGGDGSPSSTAWSFTQTYTANGIYGYHCEVHGSPGSGMFGTITVHGPTPPGSIQFTASAFPVDEAAGSVFVTLSRVGGSDGEISAVFTTSNGTAIAGQDYTAASETFAWSPGDASIRTISLPIIDDVQNEPTETFFVTLSNPNGGGTIGSPATTTVSIHDNDAAASPGTLALLEASYSGTEGGVATITVTRQGGIVGPVSVSYATVNGTAIAGSDYTGVSGSVTFADGQAGTKTFTIPLSADDLLEGAETFSIVLSAPTGGADLGSPSVATVTISDDESPPPPPGDDDLSDSEVACDAARLTGLLARAGAVAPHNTKTTNLAISFTATGDFSGIATSGNGPATPDAALAFSSNPEETTLLRNPARPQLFSVSVTRNDLNSELVAAGNSEELRLKVNPTLDADPPQGNLLAIDNLAGTAGRAADAKPGRGLAPLLVPCHGDFSTRDVHVFRTLEKVVRGESQGASTVEIAIYRGQEPDTYRIDALPIGADGTSRGRLSTLLEANFSPAGDLLSGTLRILARCSAGQTNDCTNVTTTAAIALFKPVSSGFPPPSTDRVSTAGAATAAIDFSNLLEGTTWKRPL